MWSCLEQKLTTTKNMYTRKVNIAILMYKHTWHLGQISSNCCFFVPSCPPPQEKKKVFCVMFSLATFWDPFALQPFKSIVIQSQPKTAHASTWHIIVSRHACLLHSDCIQNNGHALTKRLRRLPPGGRPPSTLCHSWRLPSLQVSP